MVQLLFILLVMLVAIIVIAPFIREPAELKRYFRKVKSRRRLEYLQQEKDRAYEILTDLTYEHAGGKISDDDYIELKEDFINEGTTVLKRIDVINRKIADRKARRRRKRRVNSKKQISTSVRKARREH